MPGFPTPISGSPPGRQNTPRPDAKFNSYCYPPSSSHSSAATRSSRGDRALPGTSLGNRSSQGRGAPLWNNVSSSSLFEFAHPGTIGAKGLCLRWNMRRQRHGWWVFLALLSLVIWVGTTTVIEADEIERPSAGAPGGIPDVMGAGTVGEGRLLGRMCGILQDGGCTLLDPLCQEEPWLLIPLLLLAKEPCPLQPNA